MGYCFWMPRLATTYHSDTSFNAHLGRSLNGMHKAFVSIGLLINRLFLLDWCGRFLDAKIGYYGRCGMPRLATTYHSDTSFNAHLGQPLNGMHKAFVSIGLPINQHFSFATPYLIRVSVWCSKQKAPIFRLRPLLTQLCRDDKIRTCDHTPPRRVL